MTDDADEVLAPKDISFMNANQLHSVNTTPEHSKSDVAWLVIEGAEEKTSSVLYSVVPDLSPVQSSEGLYVPASAVQSAQIVHHVLGTMKKG